MLKQYIEIGKIVTTHGIKGEVKIMPWADSPNELLKYKKFYTDKNGILEVENSRIHKDALLIKFAGYDSPEQVSKLRGETLVVDRADITLEEGRYLIQDLIGLNVIDVSGKIYGRLTEVLQPGANDVYVVTSDDGREILLPAIPDVIDEFLPENRIIRIKNIPEGLTD